MRTSLKRTRVGYISILGSLAALIALLFLSQPFFRPAAEHDIYSSSAIAAAKSSPKLRNEQRRADLIQIGFAIRARYATDGGWNCAAGALPKNRKPIMSGPNGYNLALCLVPEFLTEMPFDPGVPGEKNQFRWNSSADYLTGYQLLFNEKQKKVTVYALNGERSKLQQVVILGEATGAGGGTSEPATQYLEVTAESLPPLTGRKRFSDDIISRVTFVAHEEHNVTVRSITITIAGPILPAKDRPFAIQLLSENNSSWGKSQQQLCRAQANKCSVTFTPDVTIPAGTSTTMKLRISSAFFDRDDQAGNKIKATIAKSNDLVMDTAALSGEHTTTGTFLQTDSVLLFEGSYQKN